MIGAPSADTTVLIRPPATATTEPARATALIRPPAAAPATETTTATATATATATTGLASILKSGTPS